MLACAQSSPKQITSQAGLCSANRQIRVNAILTIVINAKFIQIGSVAIAQPEAKKAAEAAPRNRTLLIE
jgi:hypothetical protein